MMIKTIKKRLLLSCMIFFVALIIFMIWRVNFLYGNVQKDCYPMNTIVSSSDFTYEVIDYDILLVEETEKIKQYNPSINAILLVKIHICSREGEKRLFGANFMAQSKEWGNSMDPELFSIMNYELIEKEWNEKVDENGMDVLIPFPMYAVQFNKFDFNKIYNEQYELLISITPYKSILLKHE